MIRPFRGKAALAGGAYGAKAVSISDIDLALDRLLGDGEAKTPGDLYKVVAWVFWCTQRRANAVAGMPYSVFPLEVEEDDPDEQVEWGLAMRQVLWMVEAWLCLKGAAYVLKQMRGQTLDKLRVLNANSMRVLTYTDEDGPTSFEQRFGNKRRVFQADELLYFRLFNPGDDIREGVAPGHVGRKPSALIDAINDYAGAFFENGAVPLVLLTTQGTVPPVEKTRIQQAWAKLFQGRDRAFGTAVLEQGLTPTVVGQPNTDLAMPEMDDSKRDQILGSFGLPPGLAKTVTSRAERDALEIDAYTECYIPQCETWIEPVLNEQLFNPLGLRVSFQYSEIEVLQMRELEKAESSAFLISIIKGAYEGNAASLEEYRAWLGQLGQWSNMPPLDEHFEPEERTPPQLQPFTGQQPAGGDEETAPGEMTPIDERIESRMPKALDERGDNGAHDSADPKAPAPGWGRLKVSLPN